MRRWGLAISEQCVKRGKLKVRNFEGQFLRLERKNFTGEKLVLGNLFPFPLPNLKENLLSTACKTFSKYHYLPSKRIFIDMLYNHGWSWEQNILHLLLIIKPVNKNKFYLTYHWLLFFGEIFCKTNQDLVEYFKGMKSTTILDKIFGTK